MDTRHVRRGAGGSAVAAAAYRSGEKLRDARTGELHDYTRRYGVVASGITLPETGGPAWTREELWNAAEAAERQRNARVARMIEVALPAEMSADQRQALVAAWAGDVAKRYGVAVDWAIHLSDREGDRRNHHTHLLVSTREIGPAGFGQKAALELSNTDQRRRGLLVGDAAIYALRVALAERLNDLAERYGLDLQADPRSYAARGVDLEPTKHIGAPAVAMERRGFRADRMAEWEAVRRDNRERILARPEIVFETLTRTEAVFTRYDVARELNRHLKDAGEFRQALSRLDASPELVRLTAEEPGRPALYSTREMIAAEEQMIAAAETMTAARSHSVADAHRGRVRERDPTLSEEQQKAVEHVTAPGQLAVIAGAAGTGKSAALAVAGETWEAAGYRVRGAALAGKAAEALQEASGIESRTLASLEYGWRRARDPLTAGDVLVVDEAGMVGSHQLGRMLETAQAAGAKVVLVGDSRQLQPIEAGAAFRAVAEAVGVAEIGAVRRQREVWARGASEALARGEIAAGVAAYAARGQVRFHDSREAAKAQVAQEYVAGGRPESALILAHTNEDVRDLNARVRDERRRLGELGEGMDFATARGEREFAVGDRVVFLRNDRALGLKNGTLGTVETARQDTLSVQLDGGARVQIDAARYVQFDHGYAVTVHKAQGTTVDRAYVLASGGMDRHLAYVSLTRHRDTATLYAGRDEFCDEAALTRRLGRARPKASSLDFAERRGVETVKPRLENVRAWLVSGRERLAQIWERAERGAAALRAQPVQKATPDRAAVLRQAFSTYGNSDAAAENARRQKLQKMFVSERPQPQRNGGGDPTATDERVVRLRREFGQDRTAAREEFQAARRARLREAFAEGRALGRKTPEQMRQALQERGKPGQQRDAGNFRDWSRGEGGGRDIDR